MAFGLRDADCAKPANEVARVTTMTAEAAVSLSAGDLAAIFWPQSGMLCASLRHRGAELLRRIEDLEAAKTKGSTAGIPLLYPWANRLDSLHYHAGGRDVILDRASPLLHFDDHGLSMHGVPWGQLVWEVVEAKRDSILARLEWQGSDLLSIFPYPHRLQMAAILRPESLTLQTTVLASAGSGVPVSFGFHPYFGIPLLPRQEWHLDLPVMRRLLLDQRGIPTGGQEPFGPIDTTLGDTNFDDGFAVMDSQAAFSLSGAGRRITVTFLEGYAYAQVFAPKNKDFIALEPMTAPTSALTSGQGLHVVEPGGEFRASFRVSVQSAS
jgi:aldose 1-epimerase